MSNLPRNVGMDVPQGKLNSLSFASMKGAIASDLALLAEKTKTIRSYEYTPDLPEMARKNGLTLIQGAFISPDIERNKKEIQYLIDSANANPDVVKRVIVGNELLLRYFFNVDQVIGMIRTVKKAVKQPVSYADVSSVYLKYPQLINEVDFVTIHILPYWEDDPVAIEKAPEHIIDIYQQIRKKVDSVAPDKPILIGETGWPGAGRQRGRAMPSVVNEAIFTRSLVELAAKNGFDYNLIEAFNQPWKHEFEGVVGANWGLFSDDRKAVFPLTGKVYENPEWHMELFAATGLFLLIELCFYQQIDKLAQLGIVLLSIFLVFGQLLSALLVSEARWLLIISFTGWQFCYAGIVILLSAAMTVLLLQRAFALLTNTSTGKGAWLYRLYIIAVGFALYETFWLSFDGRYLNFPYPAVYIPVIGMMYLMIVHFMMSKRHFSVSIFTLNNLTDHSTENARYDNFLNYFGYFLVVMILVLLVGETYSFTQGGDLVLAYPDRGGRIWRSFGLTISNGQLLKWISSLIVLAIPLLASGYIKKVRV
ncbi:MAG: exo-beta-1,3-glucanase [Methylococcales bacterium]|nr:exo-beta-1,3-glucanase [Methylococcales bacterium]